jgi:glycosyltransferase involved in cell wall biosynthesis
MRLLLVHNAAYFPSYAGGSRSDQLMAAALARRDHDVRVIARVDDGTYGGREEYVQGLADRGIAAAAVGEGAIAFGLDAVDVHAVTRERLRPYVLEQVERFDPDLVLISTDPLNMLLNDVTRRDAARTVYVARSPILLPFGPHAAFPSRVKTEAIRRARAVITVSSYLADYIRTHAGIDATHVPVQMMEQEDWPALGHPDNRFVTTINPCALKGIAIFAALADLFPETAFAFVPTWGTTARDRADLLARPNMTLLEPRDDIREILRLTRVMLVPSLWGEARARIMIESMLCGVPVLASDAGGNRESTLGVPCLLPVNPIVRYADRFDERKVRVPDVPPQNLGPWRGSLARLLADRDHYAAISASSRLAALRYASELNIIPLESLLRGLSCQTPAIESVS